MSLRLQKEMLEYAGERKEILQRLWLVASHGCCLAIIWVSCPPEFVGAEAHADGGNRELNRTNVFQAVSW